MIENPNLSIVLPTDCNAKCSFCFWKYEDAEKDYYKNLSKHLETLPAKFNQISITGGEPTIEYGIDLARVLNLIDKSRWQKVVLTTNGTWLKHLVPHISSKVDHINISRHHYLEPANKVIFGSDTVPSKWNLQETILECNKEGIDVCLNCVLLDNYDTPHFVKEYIKFAKDVGASKVCFRKDDRLDDMSPTVQEVRYDDWKTVSEGGCPACRSKTQIINGMEVTWKAALKEPSNALKDVYELIYHPNAKLTTDWEGKNIFHIRKKYSAVVQNRKVLKDLIDTPITMNREQGVGSLLDKVKNFERMKPDNITPSCGKANGSSCGSSFPTPISSGSCGSGGCQR